MLVFYFVGLMFWLGYGILTNSLAVIAANTVSGILVLTAIALKITWKDPSERVLEQKQGEAGTAENVEPEIPELSEVR